LRGDIVGDAGEPIPYAVVLMQPGFGERFADNAGHFVIAHVSPGQYRLVARQVGYKPFDSLVTVAADAPAIRIQLERIAIRLAELRVVANGDCRAPSDTTGSDLGTIFEQLRQNAERFQLLADRYPFRYRMERRLADIRRNGTEAATVDTILLTSNARWPYMPGMVVTPETAERGRASDGTQLVHLPVLADFADSAFRASHCFTYRGLERVEGSDLIRVDFKPLRRISDPDVEGAVYLDPQSYQVRNTRVSLTQLFRAARGVSEWTAITTFHEIVANLVVIQHVNVLTTLIDTPRSGPVVARSEDQRLLSVDFVRPLTP
jgi:hypothetical protein